MVNAVQVMQHSAKGLLVRNFCADYAAEWARFKEQPAEFSDRHSKQAASLKLAIEC
jgi:hypothetical protein